MGIIIYFKIKAIMGQVKSLSVSFHANYFDGIGGRFHIEFKSANASDQSKIMSVIGTMGFEKVYEISQKPEMQSAMEECGCPPFPDDEADLDVWFDEMTPEQGTEI